MDEQDEIILDTIIDKNDQRLTLTKDEWGLYKFKAEIPGKTDDDPWTIKKFDTADEAHDWIAETERKRARAKRAAYSFPVTVHTRISRWRSDQADEHVYDARSLKGINATTGNWKVSGDSDVDDGRIFRRMDDDDADRAVEIRTEIDALNQELREIHKRYELKLPHTFRGRLAVDEAMRVDEKMAALFEETDK